MSCLDLARAAASVIAIGLSLYAIFETRRANRLWRDLATLRRLDAVPHDAERQS